MGVFPLMPLQVVAGRLPTDKRERRGKHGSNVPVDRLFAFGVSRDDDSGLRITFLEGFQLDEPDLDRLRCWSRDGQGEFVPSRLASALRTPLQCRAT
jgi:hypothetical protein